jgi:hypothetical protein
VALTFTGIRKEGFIRLDDPLQAVGLSGRRQRQEAMALAETGVFVDPALLGAGPDRQALNQRRAVIELLLLVPQAGQRGSRQGRKRVSA